VSQVASIQPPNAVITDIAVDSTYVYWTQGQEAPNGANYKPFSGGSIVSILESPDPRGIVADGTNVFWTDFETGGIYSYGTVVKALQPPLVAPAEDGGPAAGSPTAITTDGTNVYWVDPVANTVSQISVNGGTPHVLAQSQSNPVAIAVYGANVYWIDYASGSSDGSIDTVPVGSTNATVKALVTGETKPWGLAVDGTSVYWTDETNPGTVKSFPTAAASGATATVLATNQGAPTGIAVDAQYVYWTNFNDGTVVKVALTGGTPFVLASGLNNPSAIAVDNKNVYWADGDATIDKVAK
jgi:sugar lactone lactonase YvrE